MKITSIAKAEIHHITTDEEEHHYYIRYSPDSWMVTMGESEETVYDCEELEEAFQNYKEVEE